MGIIDPPCGWHKIGSFWPWIAWIHVGSNHDMLIYLQVYSEIYGKSAESSGQVTMEQVCWMFPLALSQDLLLYISQKSFFSDSVSAVSLLFNCSILVRVKVITLYPALSLRYPVLYLPLYASLRFACPVKTLFVWQKEWTLFRVNFSCFSFGYNVQVLNI